MQDPNSTIRGLVASLFKVFRSRGLRDIRRRIWKRSDLETGSGRGRTDFRSVPEVDPVDPRVPLRSQVAGYHRFRDIAFSALGFPPLPA